ncbi:hypothetical protein BHM03_00004994 [Ensete ventricosum]|nr:hypothetical protein BHM03_00004994 [Ensete ventricosum]
MAKHRGESSKMGQAGPLPQAVAGGLQVQTRSQVVGAAHEERDSEQVEQEVTGTWITRYWVVPPKIDRRRPIEEEIDHRQLIEEEKGKKKRKRRKKTSPARCRRPCPWPLFLPCEETESLLARGERSRRRHRAAARGSPAPATTFLPREETECLPTRGERSK